MSSVSSTIPLVSHTAIPFPSKYSSLRGDRSNLPSPSQQYLSGPDAEKYRVEYKQPGPGKNVSVERFVVFGAEEDTLYAEVLLSRSRSNFYINLGLFEPDVKRKISELSLNLVFE